MQPKEKIVRAVWNCYEGTKDCVVNNVVSLVNQGKLKLDPKDTQFLLSMLTASINEGFQKSANVLENEITAALSQVEVRTSKKN